MGLAFRVVAPEGVEEAMQGAAPEALAVHNAQRKARAVAGRHLDALVIGADTIVVLEGAVFGKPRDMAEAARMLEKLTGRTHEVITGVCLIHRTEFTFAETSRVRMRPLNREQIGEYLKKIHPLDKAGAYAAQEYGEMILEHIEGSFTNVMGLPTERLRSVLAGRV